MKKVILFVALSFLTFVAHTAPVSFDSAKQSMRHVYADQRETFYCGCTFKFVGTSGAGRTDLSSCGYSIRKQPVRAERIEWEHVKPSYDLGRQRTCWREGGRDNCTANDPVFNAMEADMFNLVPAVGEVNADRLNYRFGLLPGAKAQHGACPFRVDFSQRTAQPPESVRGEIARIYFYMHDRYGLSMSRQQEQLYMAWDKSHPVSAWELKRNERIAMVMGHSNEFVTGKRTWKTGYKPKADGLAGVSPSSQAVSKGLIRGNKRSRVFHLPEGCPSYDAMAPHNIVEFDSVEAAVGAGYRQAGNCR